MQSWVSSMSHDSSKLKYADLLLNLLIFFVEILAMLYSNCLPENIKVI